jgi:hypothetical protein
MKTPMQLLFEEMETLSEISKFAGDTTTSGLIDFLCERKDVSVEHERKFIMDVYRDGCNMASIVPPDKYYDTNFTNGEDNDTELQ